MIDMPDSEEVLIFSGVNTKLLSTGIIF
jgi:hypothetical protein